MKKLSKRKQLLHDSIHSQLERELAQEQSTDNQLADLYAQMGTDQASVQAGSDQESIPVGKELFEQAESPEQFTNLLAALGPKQLKMLEKAIERLKADPSNDFSEEEIDKVLAGLREFTAELYLAAKDLDEEVQRMYLEYQIEVEEAKQAELDKQLSTI